MYVVSCDVATKSLAISIIEYNTNFESEIIKNYEDYKLSKNNILNEIESLRKKTKQEKTEQEKINQKILEIFENYNTLLKNIINIQNNKIKIKYLEVKDLIPGKKLKDTNTVIRTTNLYNYLNEVIDPIIKLYEKNKLIFLIEYQMGPNDKSRVISSQLLYHFTKYKSDIHLVGPSLKNKIIIGNNKNLLYSTFIEKYKSNYTANKNHSKANFLEIIKILKNENLILNINKKNIDDIADSVLMSITWTLINS